MAGQRYLIILKISLRERYIYLDVKNFLERESNCNKKSLCSSKDIDLVGDRGPTIGKEFLNANKYEECKYNRGNIDNSFLTIF